MEDIVAVLLRAGSSPVLFPYLTGRLDLLSRGNQLGQTPRWWLGPDVAWSRPTLPPSCSSTARGVFRLFNCFLLGQFSEAPFLHGLPCGISCNPAASFQRAAWCCSHVPDGSSQGASPRWWEYTGWSWTTGPGPVVQLRWWDGSPAQVNTISQPLAVPSGPDKWYLSSWNAPFDCRRGLYL